MGFVFSPFIVPVAAFVMVLGIIAINSYHRIQVRRMQSEERLAAIARGLPLPPEPPSGKEAEWSDPAGYSDPYRRAARARSTGIILLFVGLGIMVGMGVISYVVHDSQVLAGLIGGIIPLLIGVGMLVDYSMQKRDLVKMEARRAEQASGQSAPPLG
jgi:hypothetical protein